MALKKTVMTKLMIEGEYLRITEGIYAHADKRFQVKVSIYKNEDHARTGGSLPLDEFQEYFDCGMDLTSSDNFVKQAYQQLKTGFTEFNGSEDC